MISTSTYRVRAFLKRGAEWLLGRPLPPVDNDPVASGHLVVGEHSYGWPKVNVYPGDTGKVTIGKFSATAADVEVFVGGNHRTDWVSTFPFRIMFDLPGRLHDGAPSSKGDVQVGHDVWIGKGAKILSGVRIGNGAVIGAYAVVSRDVRAYAIAVGNPAVEVRRRFDDARIEALERAAWWDWPIEQVLDSIPLLSSPDIDSFLARFDPGVRP